MAFPLGGASAADLGGNCCADLEERIAELEATTARKGNRKVSLTVSGWVWPAGHLLGRRRRTNVYVHDLGTTLASHVKFTGQATISPGWTAGYVLHIEAVGSDSLTTSASQPRGPAALAGNANGVQVVQSYWFVKSEQLGKVSVGTQSHASDNTAILVDGSGSLVPANYVMYDVNNFGIRTKNVINGNGGFSGLTWGSIASCAPLDGGGGVAGDCDGYPSNNVRYDSPVFAGFSVSASWGEDDNWAVSSRYIGEWANFKVAAAVAYNASTDENGPGSLLIIHNKLAAQAVQAGAYIEHIPTGLWVYGAYSKEFIDQLIDPALSFQFGGDASDKPEGNQWYVKAGIRQRWTPFGHTILYGEYGRNNDRMSSQAFLAGVTSTELRQYGVGVVQEIDAAAMSVWLGWRHYNADATCTSTPDGFCDAGAGDSPSLNAGHNNLNSMDIIKGGALINF